MTRTKTILTVVTVFVLFAVFTGCTKTKTGAAKAGKGELEQTTFNLGFGGGTAHLFAPVAKEEGFFEEEGLDVTLIQFSGNTDYFASLESGKLDAAFVGSVPTITYLASGHDFTIFGGAMTGGHGYVIKTKYVPAGYKEGDLSVLKGRTIACYKYSILDYELQLLLKKNGIGIGEGTDKVNLVYFPGGAATYAALSSNEIDGAAVTPPYIYMANSEGHTVVFFCKDIKQFENQPCCRQIALTENIIAKPNTYIAFERAMIKAYKFSQENHEKTVEYIAKYAFLDKKIIEYEVYQGHALSIPDPDKKATSVLKNDVIAFGFTDGTDFDIEKHYNTEIYKKALEQILVENPNDPIYKSLETRFKSAN